MMIILMVDLQDLWKVQEDIKMKAIKVEFIIEEDEETEEFIKLILPSLKEEYKLKQMFWHSCEYFGEDN